MRLVEYADGQALGLLQVRWGQLLELKQVGDSTVRALLERS